MVNSNDFNAFALPGGFVYVNRGVAERSDKLDQFMNGGAESGKKAARLILRRLR